MPNIDIRACIDDIQLVPLSTEAVLDDFISEYAEYTTFLIRHARDYQGRNISFTHLLIHKEDNKVMAYMTLSSDAILLSPKEKDASGLEEVPYSTIPALKIGKLSVNATYKDTYRGIGSLMLDFARAFAYSINETGIACRFLTIDADIENNPTVVRFYERNGFRQNEKYTKRTASVSMRKDIFCD